MLQRRQKPQHFKWCFPLPLLHASLTHHIEHFSPHWYQYTFLCLQLYIFPLALLLLFFIILPFILLLYYLIWTTGVQGCVSHRNNYKGSTLSSALPPPTSYDIQMLWAISVITATDMWDGDPVLPLSLAIDLWNLKTQMSPSLGSFPCPQEIITPSLVLLLTFNCSSKLNLVLILTFPSHPD